ncbi:MAG: hypothetical protein GF416_02980 [Candidatus Altiarchaeales archaeon]|nr:hypothetical protein [Candidatus Altiarchaeales archaeon]MBD3416084.1 hypothetical protein [Candidatus Altiarchaeales archaeon]
MGLLGSFFWRGVKEYTFLVFDVSLEGDAVNEIRALYTRAGIKFNVGFDQGEQDKTVKFYKKNIKYMAKTTRTDKKEIKKVKDLLRLLHTGRLKVFTAKVEIDTNYVTKKEKNMLIVKRGEVNDRIIEKMRLA